MAVTRAFTLGQAASQGSLVDRDGAVKEYVNIIDLPTSGITPGTTSYVSSNNRFYIWTGNGWYNVALTNTAPTFDSGGAPELNYQLDSNGGTPITIQLSATDPEDIPIQWSYVASDSAQYFADITQDSSIFTITAKPNSVIEQYDSSGGVFSITFKASDGVNLVTALSEFTININVSGFNLSQFSTVEYHGKYDITEEATASGLFLKPDGTSIYVTGYTGDSVYRYDMSTPWDITTASYVNEISVSSYSTSPQALYFTPTGSSFFVGNTAAQFRRYDMSTPWDITTAVGNTSQDAVVVNEFGTSSVNGLYFRPDGSYFYVSTTSSTTTIRSYQVGNGNFNIANNISVDQTATLLTGTEINDFTFKSDGSALYVISAGNGCVDKYVLSTPWDLSTLTYNSSIPVQSANDTHSGLALSSDGLNLYATGIITDSIHQYKMTDAFSFTPNTNIVETSVSVLPEAVGEDLYISPDGENLYLAGMTLDGVRQYTLSTPWDITTASEVYAYSTNGNGGGTNIKGVYLSTDGTRMFTVDLATDLVYQHNLSTPWDLSTASYSSISYSTLSPNGTGSEGLTFSYDGTKMYTIQSTIAAAGGIFQHDLSTPWDLSTASYNNVSSNVLYSSNNAYGIHISSDSLNLYVVRQGGGLYQIDLPTPNSLGDATLSHTYFPAQASYYKPELNGVFSDPTGKRIYIININDDKIHQYTLN